MTADRGPRYVFSDERCPASLVDHITNGTILCVGCGAWVIQRQTEEPADPEWLQTIELTIHEHDPEAWMVHPVSSMWVKHNHTIPDQQTIEIKNIIGRHVERFHMRGYVAPLPKPEDLA